MEYRGYRGQGHCLLLDHYWVGFPSKIIVSYRWIWRGANLISSRKFHFQTLWLVSIIKSALKMSESSKLKNIKNIYTIVMTGNPAHYKQWGYHNPLTTKIINCFSNSPKALHFTAIIKDLKSQSNYQKLCKLITLTIPSHPST